MPKHLTMTMKGKGNTKVYMKGRGMGSVLLGQPGGGAGTALVSGPSVGSGLGAGFKPRGMGFLEQTALKSEGVIGLKKKLGNIKF